MNPRRQLEPKSSGLNQNRSTSNLSNFRGSSSNLNATMNTTISGTSYTPAVYTPDQMDKMEINYQKHAATLACLQEFIVDRMIAEQEAASTTHLMRQNNKATQLKIQEAELENQIAIIQSKKATREKVDQLQRQIFESKSVLNTQVKKQVELLVHLVNSTSNKLYLKGNVSKLEQKDLTELQELVENCSALVKELLKRAGCTDGLKDVANDIKLLKEKQKEVQNYLNELQKLDNVIGQNTLRVLSDQLDKVI